MNDLLFIIPMKNPLRAKSRLAAVLPDAVRARLAMALYRRMLGFLQAARPAVDILVVSDAQALQGALSNAMFLHQKSNGLNAAVSEAAAWAVAHGYTSICVLPADLADPCHDDLERLLALKGGVVLAPAHDGGTNALLATPPDAIDFCFGRGSCAAHQKAAELAGVTCTIVPLESLKYDIDTSTDLARIRGVAWA